MKLSIHGAVLSAVPRTTMFWSSAMGTLAVMMKNAKAKLKLAPEMNTVTVVPEASPLAPAGTEFITEARFGDWKSPIPAPTRNNGKASCQKVTVLPTVPRIRKPIIDTMSPEVAKNLGPYLSER